MSPIKIGDIMDELAQRLRAAPSLEGRTYEWPLGSVTPPAAIVSYPTDGTFDATYGRGMDRMRGVVVVVVGRPTERQSRDLLTKYMDGSGAESVKALLDGDDGDYASCHSVRVAGWETDVYTVGGIDYLTAVFDLDIAGQGA